MNKPTKPEIWVCLDRDGYPVYTAGWPEACHEHINDAILNGDKSASKWVVRQTIIEAKLTESVLIDGVVYTLPIEVACELLRLNIELLTAQKDAAWQPIETAPKDETLLGFVPHSMGGYVCPIAHSTSGRWFNASCIDFSRVKPSHWKPASYPSIGKTITREAT